ncbi:unnamed protein product [Cylicostephanus goldi]|uniref:Uncharacterized protein n=1 Tax=Cylicostephanus goldi TaxID=71465 RepID=A0A3P6TIY3_CYLGO|nr:unnamed protein product [Cylicostephanus goldi]
MHELLRKQTTSQVLTNYLELRTENRLLVSDLVRLLPPRCTIVICPNGVVEPDIFLDSKFFDLDVVKLASDLRISVKSGLTDDQLVKLQANVLRISSAYITSGGINRLILVRFMFCDTLTCFCLNLCFDTLLKSFKNHHRIDFITRTAIFRFLRLESKHV